jgi:hypothetical protein
MVIATILLNTSPEGVHWKWSITCEKKSGPVYINWYLLKVFRSIAV